MKRALLILLGTLALGLPAVTGSANVRREFLGWMRWERGLTHLTLEKVMRTLRERRELLRGANHWDLGNFMLVLRMEGRGGERRELMRRIEELARELGKHRQAMRWYKHQLKKLGVRCREWPAIRTNGEKWPPKYRCPEARGERRLERERGREHRRHAELKREQERRALVSRLKAAKTVPPRLSAVRATLTLSTVSRPNTARAVTHRLSATRPAAATPRARFLAWMGWQRGMKHLSLSKIKQTLTRRPELIAGMNHWDLGNFMFVLWTESRDPRWMKLLSSLSLKKHRPTTIRRVQSWFANQRKRFSVPCYNAIRVNGRTWPPRYRCPK